MFQTYYGHSFGVSEGKSIPVSTYQWEGCFDLERPVISSYNLTQCRSPASGPPSAPIIATDLSHDHPVF